MVYTGMICVLFNRSKFAVSQFAVSQFALSQFAVSQFAVSQYCRNTVLLFSSISIFHIPCSTTVFRELNIPLTQHSINSGQWNHPKYSTIQIQQHLVCHTWTDGLGALQRRHYGPANYWTKKIKYFLCQTKTQDKQMYCIKM